MPYYFLNSLHKMACTYKMNIGDKERILFHHRLIKIIVSYRLRELGEAWESFLMRNGFGENEEWPRQKPRLRRRRIKDEQAELDLEDFGSQGNMDNEASRPSQIENVSGFKFETETNPEVPIDNPQT